MLSRTTSRMAAITNPRRWGYEIVQVRFGQVVVPTVQDTAVAGDLLRNLETGEVQEFLGREGQDLILRGL